MKKIIFLLSLLMVVVISGCATGQSGTGGSGNTSGHQGRCH